MTDWEVHAVKYADRNARTRADSFILADNHAAPHPMDYFMWVLKRGDDIILVDTGYDDAEAANRDRPIRMDPVEALKPLGLGPEDITTLIVTHLHYDHAGGLHLFPNATLHMQAAEMAFATGCHLQQIISAKRSNACTRANWSFMRATAKSPTGSRSTVSADIHEACNVCGCELPPGGWCWHQMQHTTMRIFKHANPSPSS